jgi:hypothetical protein
MKKSTAITILSVTLLLSALAGSFNAVRSSQPYLDCASRLVGEAPPGDRLPPERFRRLLRAFHSTHDLYLSRVLAHECAMELGAAPSRFGRRLFVLGTLKARLPLDQRENLDAVLLPAHGGRGLTYSAQTEWGRPPEALTDAEMTWLLVVGSIPTCTRAGAVPERDRHACAYNYKLLLSKLGHLDPAAPATGG